MDNPRCSHTYTGSTTKCQTNPAQPGHDKQAVELGDLEDRSGLSPTLGVPTVLGNSSSLDPRAEATQNLRPSTPKDWSAGRRWQITILISILTLLGPMSSSMVAPALEDIARDFRISSSFKRQLVLSIFVLLYGVVPVLAGPLSEQYGGSLLRYAGVCRLNEGGKGGYQYSSSATCYTSFSTPSAARLVLPTNYLPFEPSVGWELVFLWA